MQFTYVIATLISDIMILVSACVLEGMIYTELQKVVDAEHLRDEGSLLRFDIRTTSFL